MDSGTRTPLSAHLLIAATLLASFCLHLYFSLMPDSMGDMRVFSFWAYQVAHHGIAGAYAAPSIYPIDYPPGYLYVLQVVAWLHRVTDTSSFGPSGDIQFWIPTANAFADIITAGLIYLAVRRVASWRTAYLSLFFYAFNPAIVFASAYWGVMDSMNVMLTILALVLLEYRRPELSWVAITAAVLTKQFAAPVSLVIALLSLKRYGWKRSLVCAGFSLAVFGLMLSPLLANYPLLLSVQRVMFDFGNMSYITANAHNIWWIVTGGPPWADASLSLLGPVSYQSFGTTAFCLLWATCLAALWWKKSDFQSTYLVTALITFGFFMVVTHMHENHLHTSVAILAIVASRNGRLAALYGLASATLLANMVLHDPYLVTEYLYGIPFDTKDMMAFTVAPAGESVSRLHLWLTFANASINVMLLVALSYLTWAYMREPEQSSAPKRDETAEITA